MNTAIRSTLIVFLLAPWAGALLASEVPLMGVVSVVDGDTLSMGKERIRMHGIDAPESSQTCLRAGRPWRCGQAAALALSDRIGRQIVRCELVDRDRWGRAVATCFVGADSLNQWLVQEGWALDWPRYSRGKYAEEQRRAEEARLGIWTSEFQAPWDWRRSK